MIKIKYLMSKLKMVYKNEGLSGISSRISRLALAEKSKIKLKINQNDYKAITAPIIRQEITENSSVVYTIVSKNYMHYALTVRESFLEKNPDSDFVIFLMDKLMSDNEVEVFNDLLNSGVKIIGFDEISNNVRVTYFKEMLFKFTVLEMNTGLKPFAMEYLMNNGYEKVMYIDPDILFYREIDRILNKLDSYDVLLTPHMLAPYNDEKKPTEIDIMMAGTYNLGFLAIKNTENTLNMVRWWQERLYEFGFSDIKNGMFTDQKWMDLTPSLYDKVFIFKDPGHNVAYWNMHERNIETINGEWFVNGEPLVFFHFSGLPLYDIETVSKHQNRHNLQSFPKLKPLFEHYVEIVQSFGPTSFSKMRYYYNYIGGSDIEIQDYLRKDYKNVFELTSNPSSSCVENIHLLLSYFYNTDELLNRHARLLYQAREDLQIAFPDIDNVKKSKEGFINWYNHDQINNRVLYENKLQYGINLIGYFNNIIGVAQVARNFCKLSLGTSLPISIDIVNSQAHHQISTAEQDFYSKYSCDTSNLMNNFIFVNADVIEDYKKHYENKLEGKKNFGIWWWEFDDYFPYHSAFNVVDELIVFTDFIGSALKKVSPANVKINKMPYPFIQDWGELLERSTLRKKYGMDSDDFLFMFSFDFLSSYERKNPEAILRSFKTAFALNIQDTKLLFKVNNADLKNNEYKKFVDLIDELGLVDNVVIISNSLDRDEMISLMNASDVYISLHRSEGLGLGMLEAMSLGLPVIATGYGGNMEFMNVENSCIVDYEITEVKEDFGPYKKGWEWADPDIDQAAKYMVKLYKDKDYKIELGNKAKLSIEKQYNSKDFTKALYDIVVDV